MRRFWNDFRTGCRLSVFYIIFCVVIGSLPSPACDYNTQQPTYQCTHTNVPKPLHALFISAVAKIGDMDADGWVAVFTAILAVFTFMLVKDAKETSRKELRAYLKIATAEPCNVFNGPEETSVTLTLENVGKTPARRVIVQAAMDVVEFPLTTELIPERLSEDTAVAVCHPTQTMNYDVFLHRELTPIELSQIRTPSSTRRLCIYGRVDYVDIFDRERWTTFRIFSDVVRGQTVFTPAGEGNDAS